MASKLLSRRRFVLAGATATTAAAILGNVRRIAGTVADAAAPGALAFVPKGNEYRFDTGALRGTLWKGGKSLGLYPMTEAASGKSLAGALGIFSPYRLLTPDARFLPDTRDWSSQSRQLADGAVEVHWRADREHPLELKSVYRLAAPNAFDFHVTVQPQRKLRRFELFLSSYFDGFPASFVYAQNEPHRKGGAGFVEATKQAGDWQMFPRDAEAAQIINDGRWNFPPSPVAWKIMPRFAVPLAIRRDAESGLAAVLMAPPTNCFAVSTPYGDECHRSLYLSLFGRDFAAGETASACARLVIGKAISDAQAIALYEAYRKELK